MKTAQRVQQVNISRRFSSFNQSYYFSFGYFAFPKTEYDADSLEELGNAGLI